MFIREASIADVESIAPRLRDADREECLAATGLPPELALFYHFQNSKGKTWVGGIDQPEVMWGVDPVEDYPDTGVIWLVGTDLIFDNQVKFLRATLQQFKETTEGYELLTNYIDARNTVHIKWIKWLGFKLIRKIDKFGPKSLPFYEFVKVI